MTSDYSKIKEENEKLKQELERVRYEKDKYKKMFDVSADALSIIDLESGRFIECNRSAIDMHGVESKENFLNLRPSDLSPTFQPNGQRSEALAGEKIHQAVSKGPQLFEWVHSKLDGSTFPCLVSLTAIQVGNKYHVLAIGRDISMLSDAQKQLEDAHVEAQSFKKAYLREKEKFEKFVNLAPVGIVINEFDTGKFVYVNKEFSKFTGYKVGELNSMDYWQLTPKKYEAEEAEQLASLTTKKRYGPYKKEYIHNQGHKFPVLLSGIKIEDEDGKEYIWSVAQDITEQQTIESDLRNAKQLAESSSKARSQFLSNMSHEIRTPINGILGTLQILQRDISENQHSRLIGNAIFSAKSLLRIINDILDYSKIDANQLELETVELALDNIIESVVSDFLPVAHNKDITIKTVFAQNMANRWLSDPVRLRQILINLVSNAVKFTDTGSVTIKVSEASNEAQNGIIIAVSDTGIGMSEHALSQLFERFTQADTSITRRFGGSGLGMSITHNLVTLMGGYIRVASSEGNGTKFLVYLPIEKAATQVSYRHDEGLAFETPNLAGKCILVAEDNMINQEIVKSMLEKTNADLHFAENGRVAVDMFNKVAPDIVLMDIQMPVMDGKQAFHLIREIDAVVPIVATTANVMTEDVKEYQALGFSGYLSKPFDLSSFYRYLDEKLNN
ncbi:PAS domain S-box protein [Alteromonas sp. 345S023]|uniref:histidine kinase n=1 Tax=Alteromonas profundi TaxID=2696062 RepID=A0A7X5LL48_9ALTE|nr:ATP-binding protein [Alteromonas profundi]NDV91357.1 PAS domain S-box protein [Alteromonas profundi]